MKIRVVIPIYKQNLSKEEGRSLQQCFDVLCNYPISFVTHSNLNTNVYLNIANDADVSPNFEYFESNFFQSINSYNRLLLSRDFYSRFINDDYILIYQLDGFVFRDELFDWCNKGYEYVGAPWFTHYGHGKWSNNFKLYRVGNGGVSLRKISAFCERFDKKMPLSIFPFYVRNIRKKRLLPMLTKTIRLFFILIFTRKTIEYCIRNFTEDYIQEDCFWADGMSDTKLALIIPHTISAANFSFEKHPSYLYKLTNEKLPFACHAYEKNEYKEFWKKFMN